MHRRAVRVSLVLIMLVVVTSTLYQLFSVQQAIDTQREAELRFIAYTADVTAALTDLRAAQQAYVAAGQDPGYWVEKVSARMTDVSSGLSGLTELARTAEATEALTEADLTLQRLARVDAVVRQHTAAEQALLASDVIFTDGLEHAGRVTQQLELALAAEQDAYAARRGRGRQTQTLALSALVATTLIVALLLLPLKEAQVEAAPGQPESVASEATDEPDGVTAEPESVEASSEPSPASEPPVAVTAPHHEELQRAAELCTDLGRISSVDQLPRMLERAAELLHASGLIVWVRDATGTGLRPVVAHGYSSETLAQLGSVACSSDNAAATAYRSRELQVVPVGSATTKGALVAPLLAPDDCIGVMAAEVKAGWESSADVQATASILAAQLATLMAADPPTKTEAEHAHG